MFLMKIIQIYFPRGGLSIFWDHHDPLPEQFIKSFKKIFKKLVTVSILNEPNALTAIELQNIGQKYMPTIAAQNVTSALKQISNNERKTIVIFGSLYLIGDVLSKN